MPAADLEGLIRILEVDTCRYCLSLLDALLSFVRVELHSAALTGITINATQTSLKVGEHYKHRVNRNLLCTICYTLLIIDKRLRGRAETINAYAETHPSLPSIVVTSTSSTATPSRVGNLCDEKSLVCFFPTRERLPHSS